MKPLPGDRYTLEFDNKKVVVAVQINGKVKGVELYVVRVEDWRGVIKEAQATFGSPMRWLELEYGAWTGHDSEVIVPIECLTGRRS